MISEECDEWRRQTLRYQVIALLSDITLRHIVGG